MRRLVMLVAALVLAGCGPDESAAQYEAVDTGDGYTLEVSVGETFEALGGEWTLEDAEVTSIEDTLEQVLKPAAVLTVTFANTSGEFQNMDDRGFALLTDATSYETTTSSGGYHETCFPCRDVAPDSEFTGTIVFEIEDRFERPVALEIYERDFGRSMGDAPAARVSIS
jgi:hypothetical protein